MTTLLLFLASLLILGALPLAAGEFVLFKIGLAPFSVQRAYLLRRDAKLGDDLEEVLALVECEEGKRCDFAIVPVILALAFRGHLSGQSGDLLSVEIVNAVANRGVKLAPLHAAHLEDTDAKGVRHSLTRKPFRGVCAFFGRRAAVVLLSFIRGDHALPPVGEWIEYGEDHGPNQAENQQEKQAGRRSRTFNQREQRWYSFQVMQTSATPKGWWVPEVAAESYYRRRHRGAMGDGAMGAILAADAYTSEAVGSWYREAEGRATKGLAPVPPKPFPDWVRIALILGTDHVGKSEGDQYVFQQLVANPPLPEVQAIMAAFAEGERSVARARWAELGDQYRAALGQIGETPAPGMGSGDLGVIAAHGGRLLTELFREVKSQRGRGHPTDMLTTNFIKGVAAAYECERMGKPKPLDLAEIAVVWGISQGPRKSVLRLWNSRAAEFWERAGAGQMPSVP